MRHTLSTLLLILLIFITSHAFSQVTINNLRCEHLDNPLGIDVSNPRLTWNLESAPDGI